MESSKILDIIKSVSPYESEIEYDSNLKDDLGFNSINFWNI